MPSRLNTAKPYRRGAAEQESGDSTTLMGRRGAVPALPSLRPGATLQSDRISSQIQPARSAPRLSGIGLTVLLVGVLLPMVDFFIVNVALPTIDSDLHASQALLELVVSGYATAYALLLVLGGRLGDSIGRKRLFLIGMAAFTVTSLACGLAPSATALVAGRIAQGASAALMVPQVLATIQAATTGEQRTRAIGRYGATGGLAAVLGQVLGGLLVSANIDGSGWRPIFLVNVPIGIAGFFLARRYVPDSRHGNAARVDGRGTALLAFTVLAVLIPLTEGRSLRWPDWSLALLAAAPLIASIFAIAERRTERAGRTPLVPPSLLRHASMRRGLLLALPFFAGFGAFMFCYALLVQQGLHDSALTAGLGLVPMAVTFLLASLSTSRLLARYGAKVLAAGGLLQAVGLVVLAVTVYLGWPGLSVLWLAPGLAIAGFGQGLVMSPLFGIVLSEVPPAVAGVGSGVLTTTQQTALALGVATLGSLFLTLADDGTGVRTGFIVVLAIQVAIAVVVTGGARRPARLAEAGSDGQLAGGLAGGRTSGGRGAALEIARWGLKGRAVAARPFALASRLRAGLASGSRSPPGERTLHHWKALPLSGQRDGGAGQINDPVESLGSRELSKLPANPGLRALGSSQDHAVRFDGNELVADTQQHRSVAAGRDRRPARRDGVQDRVGLRGLRRDPGRRRPGRRVRSWFVPVAAADRDGFWVPCKPPAEGRGPPGVQPAPVPDLDQGRPPLHRSGPADIAADRMVDREQPAVSLGGFQPSIGRLAEVDPADAAKRVRVPGLGGDLLARDERDPVGGARTCQLGVMADRVVVSDPEEVQPAPGREPGELGHRHPAIGVHGVGVQVAREPATPLACRQHAAGGAISQWRHHFRRRDRH